MSKRKAEEMEDVNDGPMMKGCKRKGSKGKGTNEVQAVLSLLTMKLEESMTLDNTECAIHIDCVMLILKTLITEDKLTANFTAICVGITQTFLASLVSAFVKSGVTSYIQAISNICALSKCDAQTLMNGIKYAVTIPPAAEHITVEDAKAKLSVEFEGDPEPDPHASVSKDFGIIMATLKKPLGPPDVLASLARIEAELACARAERDVSSFVLYRFRGNE